MHLSNPIYLSNRVQYVSFSGGISKKQEVNNGVPQVSVLGPLLVHIYINDLSNFSDKPNLILCADDTTSFQLSTVCSFSI